MNEKILAVPLPDFPLPGAKALATRAREAAAAADDADGILRPLATLLEEVTALPGQGSEDDSDGSEPEDRVRELVQAIAVAAGLDPEVAWDLVALGLVGEPVTGRDEIIARVAELESIPLSEAARLVDRATDSILRTLVLTNTYEAPGVGTFKLQRREGREGRNPQTNERIVIAARTSVLFVPRPTLKSATSPAPNAEEAGLVLSIVTHALSSDCRVVYLPRIGRFLRQRTREYVGRNPRTGEPVVVEAKDRVVFSVARELRAALIALDARGS